MAGAVSDIVPSKPFRTDGQSAARSGVARVAHAWTVSAAPEAGAAGSQRSSRSSCRACKEAAIRGRPSRVDDSSPDKGMPPIERSPRNVASRASPRKTPLAWISTIGRYGLPVATATSRPISGVASDHWGKSKRRSSPNATRPEAVMVVPSMSSEKPDRLASRSVPAARPERRAAPIAPWVKRGRPA